MEPKHIVIVGDGYVGKTSILNAIKREQFKEEIPNISDNFTINAEIDGKTLILNFVDTAGQEEFAMIRELFYKEADVFLLCFAVDDKVSFENMESKWIQDLGAVPRVPIILVGTKSDLRKDGLNCISKEQINKIQKKIGALFYVECSAKTSQGIDELKKKIIRQLGKEKSCVIQ